MLSARTRPLSRGRAFKAGFRKPNARNGTQPEPRLRTLLFVFKLAISTLHETDGKFRVLENSKLNLVKEPQRSAETYFKKNDIRKFFDARMAVVFPNAKH